MAEGGLIALPDDLIQASRALLASLENLDDDEQVTLELLEVPRREAVFKRASDGSVLARLPRWDTEPAD
jgi:hypothetical protein